MRFPSKCGRRAASRSASTAASRHRVAPAIRAGSVPGRRDDAANDSAHDSSNEGTTVTETVTVRTIIATLAAILALAGCNRGGASDEPKTPADEKAATKPVEVRLSKDAIAENHVEVGLVGRRVLIPTLSAPARVAFNAEAMNLRSHALDLERAARDHKVEQMQRALDGVNASCIACHSRFRDFAGQLDFGRAAAPLPAVDAYSTTARAQ